MLIGVIKLQAHGLASGCVAQLESTERRLRRVYDIEIQWYNGRHPLTFEQHKELTNHHKTKLKEYRKSINEKMADIAKLQKQLDIMDVFSESNINNAEQLCNSVFELSVSCTVGLVGFFRSIIESSVQALEINGYPPHLSFAVVGLGSVGRGEATPFSDLEYAFIVESTEIDYFTRLAMDTYFRINNLGETEMKRFDIKELQGNDVRDIDQPKICGGSFDGIT